MDNPVIIKGNKSGIVLVLSDTEDYNLILKDLDRKLQTVSGHYEKFAEFALTIQGRELNNTEIYNIVSLFKKYGLLISDIIDSLDHSHKVSSRECTDEKNDTEIKDGLFYRGTLRNGQVLRVKKSIIVIGDVLNGATVMSNGSITIIGGLYGFAYAGVNGALDSKITALTMKPNKLRIHDIIYSNDNTEGGVSFEDNTPAMAYTEDGNMFMRRI